MKFAFIFLTFSFLWLANSTPLFAQISSDKPFIAVSDASGEESVRELEIIRNDALDTGERVFVIARRSKSEKSNQINVSRLSNARTILIQILRFPFQTTVFAEGDRVEGEGRIEFYLGSHLRLIILAKQGKIPNFTCCPDYQPPVKRKRQKRLRS